MQVNVRADGTIGNYKSFTIEEPPRIVFDIFNVKSPTPKEQVVAVNSKWVKTIRHYGYPDRVRLVVDTQKPYLNAFKAESTDSGMRIRVGSNKYASAPAGASDIGKRTEPASSPLYIESEASGDPAVVNRIEFTGDENGKSTLVIGTTKPIKFDIRKQGPESLRLSLYQTQLPEYHRRPLITTRFESAVDRVLPDQDAGNSAVLIEMRENVPYFVEQKDSLLQIHFEASAVAPKPYAQTPPPEWKETLLAASSEPEAYNDTPPTSKISNPTGDIHNDYASTSPESEVEVPSLYSAPTRNPDAQTYDNSTRQGSEKSIKSTKYTGEKIALDFYETDIKNVFRIIREVSVKNFAIDKNVTG